MPPRDLYALFMDPDAFMYNVEHTNWRGRTFRYRAARYTTIDGEQRRKWYELKEYQKRREAYEQRLKNERVESNPV